MPDAASSAAANDHGGAGSVASVVMRKASGQAALGAVQGSSAQHNPALAESYEVKILSQQQ